MKYFALAVLFVSVSAVAKPPVVQCSYPFQSESFPNGTQTVSAGVQLNPNSTYAYIRTPLRSMALAHSLDFDVPTFVNGRIAQGKISDGTFFVRRDDADAVQIRGTLGKIVQGEIVELESRVLEFGATDDSDFEITREFFSGLVCSRQSN